MERLLRDDPSSADTLSTLRDEEFALLFDWFVNIVPFGGAIRLVIMCDVVDVVLLQEFCCDNPGTARNDFIHPFAVSYCFCALSTGENCKAFALVGFGVACHTDEEIGLWKCSLGLFQLAHVAVYD